MDIIPIVIMSGYSLFWIAMAILSVYIIYKQLQARGGENFEERDN